MAKKVKDKQLFGSPQPDLYEKSYEEQLAAENPQQVECLGQTFPSDVARREHYLGLLREKLKDPEFRNQPGFPIGDDEDILRLSDPPYYTACPNPFLKDFIAHVGTPYDPKTDDYENTPFAIDVSEGKTDALYKAHSYHTKVPYKAIMPAILHYTKPGDVVLDGFCGSGMTGVAAQMCGATDKDTKAKIKQDFRDNGLPPPKWGARKSIVNDLSPIATFIAANFVLPFNVGEFACASEKILEDIESEIGWMYETIGENGSTKGRINYTVWSESFSCSECATEIVFVDEAFDPLTRKISKQISCPGCGAEQTKEQMGLVFETIIDRSNGNAIRRPKRKPSIINYVIGGQRYEKRPDALDLKIIDKIEKLELPDELPTSELPDCQMARVGRMATTETKSVHQMFLPRAAYALSLMWRKAVAHKNVRLRHALCFFVEQAIWTLSILNRYRPSGYSQVNQFLSGVFYVPSQSAEISPWYVLTGKLKRLVKVFSHYKPITGDSLVQVGDCAHLNVPNNSIDYIFTDPPFGENIYYSDLNYLIESWHKVWSTPVPEAIIDRVRKKSVVEYQDLMRSCFKEYEKALKPGRWMTVVFHNSQNSVWNAIQEALLSVGFIVADVRTLDKKQGSFQQVSSTTVKQDLVISAYKPADHFEKTFEIKAGTNEGVWEFVNAHLAQLPVFVSSVPGQVDVIAERLDHRLFDRMVAFHLQRDVSVPMSVAEFYGGLASLFSGRDGMYFLADQVVEYDKKRAKAEGVRHLEMFPDTEANTIQWLRQELGRRPRSYAEIQPDFMKLSVGWAKNEKPIELSTVLDENFLSYDGTGDVPNQIHAYLSSNFKDMRGKDKSSPDLRSKAKDRWYVPDPNKLQDMEVKREKQLLKEFDEYLASKEKRIKQPRHEVIRMGFKRAWGNWDYESIKVIATKIPEAVIQEDQQLLMWYDMALTRLGDDGN